MTKPFDKSELQGIYLHHLYSLAHVADEVLRGVLEELGPLDPEPGNRIHVDAGLHARLEQVITIAANIAKLLHVPSHKTKGKETEASRWKRSRATALNEFIGNLPLLEIRNLDARNAIEHFDLFLDRIAMGDASDGGKYAAAAYNLVLTRWSAFADPIRPLRVFVIEDLTYHSLDRVVHLGNIRDELRDLLAVIRPKFHDPAPGGTMTIFLRRDRPRP